MQSGSLAAYSERGFNVLRGDTPERVSGALVTWDFFRVLGLRPHSGRTFLPEDDREGADRVAILSWQYWTEAMQSAPMEGRTLRIDGIPHIVVGVMPREVTFPAVADVWLPLDAMLLAEHDTRPMLVAVGRMHPGRTIAAVRDELAALVPAELGWSPNVLHFADGIDDGLGPVVVLLFSAVLLVLLVACANVGNLLLARYSSRARELAVRSAIGASRIRLLRELLIEALLLSALATAGGLLLGTWLLELGFALVPPEMQLPSWLQPEMDWRVVVFATAMTVLTTTAASLGPALTASRAAAVSLMSGAARGGEPLSAVRLRRRLIVAQVTCSVVLLFGAASLYRSVQALERADWGYTDPDNVLLARVTLPEATYPDAGRAAGVLHDALAGIANIAGVSAVSGHGDEERLRGVDGVLLESSNGQTLHASGGAFVKRLSIMPGYAEAMSLTVRRGRDVAAADLSGAAPVALINESMARALGMSEDAVGSRLRVPELGAPGEALTVVGVIEDALEPQFGSTGAQLAARPTIYLPLLQHPTRDLVVAVRTRSQPLLLTQHVRKSVLSVDPAQPITQVMTLDRYLGFASAPMRWLATLFAVIGGVAFSLAALGLYGVIAGTSRAHRLQSVMG